MYDILDLDEENLTVKVEPMVSVGDVTRWKDSRAGKETTIFSIHISRYLIPRGYTLAVTLEIADATLGGLAMGVGMTTHSHKVKTTARLKAKKSSLRHYIPLFQVGLYQETVVSYEVVLADGSVVKATRDNEYSDLFYCLPWSHGTLGKQEST